MADYKIVRPLGKFEQFSSSQEYLQLYKCVTVTSQYVVPASLRSDETALHAAFEKAVAQIVLELSPLRCGLIATDTKSPSYVQVDALDLRNHITWETVTDKEADYDDKLLRIIEHQNNIEWVERDRRPPFRFHVVTRPGSDRIDASLHLHHALGDGTSTMVVHRHLLEALNHPQDLGTVFADHVLRPTEPPVLTPTQDSAVPYTESFRFLISQLFLEFAPKWLQFSRKVKPWAGQPHTFKQVNMHARLITIQPHAVKALLAACRTNSTTLTPLMHALTLFSLSKRMPVEVAPTFARLTAISMRRKVQLPPDSKLDIERSMGNYVSNFDEYIDPKEVAEIRRLLGSEADAEKQGTDAHLWKHAAQVRTALQNRLNELPRNDILGMLKYLDSWHKWFKDQEGKPRHSTWRVSNLGSLPSGAEDVNGAGWLRERHIYTQSALTVGDGFNVCVSGVIGGSIGLTITWQEGVVEPALMDAVTEDLNQWITNFGQTGSFGI